jgi:hypothetical protein
MSKKEKMPATTGAAAGAKLAAPTTDLAAGAKTDFITI